LENYYKPGDVTISHMTPEELAADRIKMKREAKKYPWRRKKDAARDIEQHIFGSIRGRKWGKRNGK